MSYLTNRTQNNNLFLCFHFPLWYCVCSNTEAWKMSVVPWLPCWFLAIANGCRNRIISNNLIQAKKQWPCTRANDLYNDLSGVKKRWFFCGSVLLFMFCVCPLPPCGHLLGKGWPLGSLVCIVFLCYSHFPMCCPGSGLVLDCIDSWFLHSS